MTTPATHAPDTVTRDWNAWLRGDSGEHIFCDICYPRVVGAAVVTMCGLDSTCTALARPLGVGVCGVCEQASRDRAPCSPSCPKRRTP